MLAGKKSMLPLFLVSQLWLYLGKSQVSVYRTIGPLVLYVSVILSHTRSSLISVYSVCPFLYSETHL